MDSLRKWKATHIDEDIPVLEGFHENELFYNCTVGSLKGVTLKDCCLTNTKFTAQTPEDFLDFTVTLNCHSFGDIELSDTAFDLILLMLVKSKGQTEKRRKLIDVIGEKRVVELLRKLAHLE